MSPSMSESPTNSDPNPKPGATAPLPSKALATATVVISQSQGGQPVGGVNETNKHFVAKVSAGAAVAAALVALMAFIFKNDEPVPAPAPPPHPIPEMKQEVVVIVPATPTKPELKPEPETKPAPVPVPAPQPNPPVPPTNVPPPTPVPSANDFPGFDKPWVIHLSANGPKRPGPGYYKEFPVRVAQGDKLRVQVEPVGGASMRTGIEVLDGTGRKLIEKPRKAGIPDWTMIKGIPGDSARVRIYSDLPGSLNVVLSKAE